MKPLYESVAWAADHGRSVAQLVSPRGVLVAEFNADGLRAFLEGAADTADVLSGSEAGVSRPDLPDVAAMRAAIEKAHDHVCDLAEGKTKWMMRIPAEPESDSDLVIGAGLHAGEKALELLAGAEQELAGARLKLAETEGERDVAHTQAGRALEILTNVENALDAALVGEAGDDPDAGLIVAVQLLAQQRDAARAAVARLEQAQAQTVATERQRAVDILVSRAERFAEQRGPDAVSTALVMASYAIQGQDAAVPAPAADDADVTA